MVVGETFQTRTYYCVVSLLGNDGAGVWLSRAGVCQEKVCVYVCVNADARACVNVSVCVRAGGDKVISSSVLVPDFNRCQSLHKKMKNK